jgi:release factor glutamine methyltransferase
MKPASVALLELGRALQRAGYSFVTVTPETHRIVNVRAERLGRARARDLRDVFGWNRAFDGELLPRSLFDLLHAADALANDGEIFRSRVRFSSLSGKLFVHSAFPTDETDAVFFGPDTYRFCALLQRWARPTTRVLDVGCGSGAGGISIATQAEQLVLADINGRALDFAHINAELSSVQAEVVSSDVLAGIEGDVDLVISNPPYMRDDAARVYRDGGGTHGEGLAVRIVNEALARLSKSGMLILYTGSAIVEGVDTFFRSVSPVLREHDAHFIYEELDPDVFGDELERPYYREVERIAAVGLRVSLR